MGIHAVMKYFFVGFKVLTAVVMKSIIFWNITSCSPVNGNQRFGGTYRLAGGKSPAFTLVYCSIYSSALKMEAICSSEMSFDIQCTPRRYIPENNTVARMRGDDYKTGIGLTTGFIRSHTITVYTLHNSLLQLQLFFEDCCSDRILTRTGTVTRN
jgi:hypothetical protein